MVLMASVVSKWFCKEGFERSIYHYSLAIPNFGYMGYALAESLFGSEGLLNVMMFGLPMSLYVYSAAFCMLTKQKFSPTNADRFVGETAVVTQAIDNIAETGLVKLQGTVWTARTADGSVIAEGEKVTVKAIEGVKLIVEKAALPAGVITQ